MSAEARADVWIEMRRDRESNGSVSWRSGNAQRIALRHCRRCGVTPPTLGAGLEWAVAACGGMMSATKFILEQR